MSALATIVALTRWYSTYWWVANQDLTIREKLGEAGNRRRILALANYAKLPDFLQGRVPGLTILDFLPPEDFWPRADSTWLSFMAHLPSYLAVWSSDQRVFSLSLTLQQRLIKRLSRGGAVRLSPKLPPLTLIELPKPIFVDTIPYDVIIVHNHPFSREGQQFRELAIFLYGSGMREYEGVKEEDRETVKAFIGSDLSQLALVRLNEVIDRFPAQLELHAMLVIPVASPVPVPELGNPGWAVQFASGANVDHQEAVNQALRIFLGLSGHLDKFDPGSASLQRIAFPATSRIPAEFDWLPEGAQMFKVGV